MEAAHIQVWAIWRKVARSSFVRAVRAHSMHSAAYSSNCFTDSMPVPVWHFFGICNSQRAASVPRDQWASKGASTYATAVTSTDLDRHRGAAVTSLIPALSWLQTECAVRRTRAAILVSGTLKTSHSEQCNDDVSDRYQTERALMADGQSIYWIKRVTSVHGPAVSPDEDGDHPKLRFTLPLYEEHRRRVMGE
jgi:hypothetical protein